MEYSNKMKSVIPTPDKLMERMRKEVAELLTIKNLKVNAGEKEILHGISLSVNKGETHVIMGPNGAGKSTMGHALMGNPTYEVTDGSMIFDGEDISEMSATERAKKGIFLSFQNPEFFLAERGYVYNMKALQAILLERTQRKIPCRILGFAVQNYTEHREFFGSARMDEAMGRINRYLATEYRGLTAFYLRNGCYALLGSGSTDLDALTARLEQRFAEPWKTRDGELPLKLSFVQADTEQLSCSADRLANTLRISLNEAVNGSRIAGRRMLSDSLGAIEQRLDIRHCLEKALEEDALEVFLQPIVESETGRWIAAEALVRIRNEAGDLIPPEQFISLAEHEGQIVKLGEQVLSKVCAFIQAHDLAGLGLSWINVNLSPMQFLSQQIPERFSEILARWGVSPRQLHLEITEQSLTDFSLLRTQINSLHGKGFEFALDDYGSGYSNLIRVMQYPFSHIKIDMEVVQNYCREQSPLLPALIQVFKQMNFSVTAEGIETKEMADALRRIGCDYFQGFYFSRPVPMEEFLSMKA